MRVKIKSDSAKMERKLENLAKKQVVFAAVVATTKTSVEVRNNYVVPKYKKTFNARNKAFGERLIHNISAADAKHAKKTGIAVAAIRRRDGPLVPGTSRRKEKAGRGPSTTSFMKRHVTGGTKTPKGQKLAIPLSNSKVSRKKAGAKAGAVTKTFEPKTIMESGKGFIIGKKGSGKSYIARKMARGGVQVLYSLKDSANIKPVYDPIPAAKKGVAARFPVQFRRAFFKALKTARLG